MNAADVEKLPPEGCPVVRNSAEGIAEIIEWLRGRGRVLIVTHDNPDPDSIAAAVALRHLILMKTGQDAVIAYGGVIGRGENRNMVKLLEIPLEQICRLDLEQFPVVCMVDTQPATGNNSFPSNRPVHIVIDHHPAKTDLSKVCWVDIREHYGASATILYEYLCSQNVSLNTKLATSLFYAIKSETQDLGRDWSKADREAYLKLLPLSNNRIMFNIVRPQVPREYFSSFRTAIENAHVFGCALVFNLRKIDNPDIVAELADFLLRQEGIKYVLGMGLFNGMQILSMRSLDPEARLGLAIQQMVEGIGTAGGHGMTAGGQIREVTADENSQNELERLLTRRMFKALQLEPVPGESLLDPGQLD